VLCERQATERGVTAESFGGALVGDTLEAAVAGFVEALADFFPSRTGAILRAAMKQANLIRQIVSERAEKMLSSQNPEAMASTLIDSAGNSAASAASIQAPSPSAS
jgi:hypothetical protein